MMTLTVVESKSGSAVVVLCAVRLCPEPLITDAMSVVPDRHRAAGVKLRSQPNQQWHKSGETKRVLWS